MSLRENFYSLSESSRFQNAILALIVLNAITIGIETFSWPEKIEWGLKALDSVILWVFILEIFIRCYGKGWKFFTDSWNNFDFAIILFSVAPSTGPLSVLRVFRVFRALRLVSSMPEMQRMVEALLRSLRGIMAISWLLVIVMYVYSVMGTMLFRDGGEFGEMYFGSLGLSLYSLFQIMTLESWSNGVARMIIEEQGWWAAIFFITYIISTSFTFLNMFIAVFTNTMAAIDIEDEDHEGFSRILTELKAEIGELKELLSHPPGIENAEE
ncbi:ion transporter [Candidatus Poseidoniaceae archaeon]|nr:ion transporter [Candidatus Poseidoniaceae archaeon]